MGWSYREKVDKWLFCSEIKRNLQESNWFIGERRKKTAEKLTISSLRSLAFRSFEKNCLLFLC